MAAMNLSEDQNRRLEALVPVVRAVMNEDVDAETVFDIVMKLGCRAVFDTIIRPQEESVLIQALHQLAEASPRLVYGHTAAMVALGADIRAQEQVLHQIGFVRATRGD